MKKEQNIFFSIIIPVYKVEKYLRECVNSVLDQTFKNIEVILVDDGSPDLCPQICDEFSMQDMRVKVIHKKNGGLSDARNKGLEIASGKYILFLDSDDYYLDNMFLEKIEKKIRNKKIDILFHQRRYYIEATKQFRDLPKQYNENINNIKEVGEILYQLSKDEFLEASAPLKVIDRNLLLKNKLFFKKGILSEDVEWFFRLTPYIKKVMVTNDIGYCYRVRKGSITKSIGEKHVLDMINIVLENVEQLLKIENIGTKKALLNYLTYQYYITLGLIWAYTNDNKLKYLRKLFKISWIAKYSIGKKTKKASYVVKYFKYLSPIIFGKYILNKNKEFL